MRSRRHEQTDPTDPAEGSARIENCKFAFKCPLRWEALRETDDPGIRHCDSCQREVYFCYGPAEAGQRARQGQCVAIQTRHVAEAGAEGGGEQILMGLPASPGYGDEVDDELGAIDQLLDHLKKPTR